MTTSRKLRLACWLQLSEGEELLGFTRSFGSSAMVVELPRPPPAPLITGTQVRFRLLRPDRDPIWGTGRVEGSGAESAASQSAGLWLVQVAIEALPQVAREHLESIAARGGARVLVVDPDAAYGEVYAALKASFRLAVVHTPEQALTLLRTGIVDVLVCAEQLPGEYCLSFFRRASQEVPRLRAARIVVSELTVGGQVRTLINEGQIFCYVRKPFGPSYLSHALQQAIDSVQREWEHRLITEEIERAHQRLRDENLHLRQRLVGSEGFESIVGRSEELQRVFDQIKRVRRTDVTVHITGETGTGKELVARALHEGGPRAKGPFVAQSLAGTTESLAESTLWGHVKGAFTGADRDHAGIFERASGGTLFLDEVAELSPRIQGNLLRVLQEGELTPLGGRKPVKVDVRVISGTHKNLREEVSAGRFREDLFFRLAVMVVELPPLRARRGDVALLAAHFLDLYCARTGKNIRGFSREAIAALEAHRWPGNVRELESEVERLVILTADDNSIPVEALSPHLRQAEAPGVRSQIPALRLAGNATLDASVESLQRTLISQALRDNAGNISRAATALGIERTRLSKLRTRLGIE